MFNATPGGSASDTALADPPGYTKEEDQQVLDTGELFQRQKRRE
jgi:hypothetical protein